MPERKFEDAPYAVREARRFARSLLDGYGEVGDVAELLVSELATNVVRHSAPPFTVDVAVGKDAVRIGVADGAGVDLEARRAAGDETSGRGLQLLDGLALTWGVERAGGGKRVWFELPISSEPR